MLEMLVLALVLSVFGATVHHILAAQVGAAEAAAGGFTSSPLRRVNPVETEDEEVPGPSWASFPARSDPRVLARASARWLSPLMALAPQPSVRGPWACALRSAPSWNRACFNPLFMRR